MINIEEVSDFISFVKKNFSQKSNEVADALELVGLVLDDIYDLIGEEVKECINLHKIDEATGLLQLSKKSLDIKHNFDEIKELFVDEKEEENSIKEEMDDDKFENSIHYAEYTVDNNVPHTLYENFTHTKPCAFALRGIKYEAWNMRDILVRLCEILAEEDPGRIKSFITDPTMRGRKNSYFSEEEIVDKEICKNVKLSNLNVYVWVNLSCNQIKNVIRKILGKFKINLSDFKIYLRADFTQLDVDKNISIKEGDNNSEKIGQHVRWCFKQIENYSFSPNEINAMQSGEWTLQTFGFSTPMIKKYDSSKTVSEQVKVHGSNRYWVDRFKLSGEEYFIVCQWQKIHREKFDAWFNSLKR